MRHGQQDNFPYLLYYFVVPSDVSSWLLQHISTIAVDPSDQRADLSGKKLLTREPGFRQVHRDNLLDPVAFLQQLHNRSLLQTVQIHDWLLRAHPSKTLLHSLYAWDE